MDIRKFLEKVKFELEGRNLIEIDIQPNVIVLTFENGKTLSIILYDYQDLCVSLDDEEIDISHQ